MTLNEERRTKYDICHICSYYENSLFAELVEAQREFSNPRVFYYQHDKHSFRNGDVDYVDRVACYKQWERVDFFKKQNKALMAYKKIYSQMDFQLNFSHSLFTNGYVAYRIKKEWKIPYIVMVQNTDLNVFFKYIVWLRNVGIDILLQADKILVASRSYRDTLLNQYVPHDVQNIIRKKIEVVPYGISDFWKNNRFDEKRTLGHAVQIVSVGSIDRNKNHLLICKAIAQARAKNLLKDVTVEIVGQGVDKRIVKKIKGYPFVKYYAYMPKEKLVHRYREADLFILLSKTETFGLVYAEALSQGIPVIYTKDQGFDKQFSEGTVGFHSDLKETEVIKTICLLLKKYRDIQPICSEKSKKFYWSNIVKRYKKIYEEILER